MNEPLEYRSRIPKLQSASAPITHEGVLVAPDRRDGLLYDCEPDLQLAVEVALVTGRPLLLRGNPGSGKSSLAAFVARALNRRYYEHVVTSTTRAADLLWRFDPVKRLSDAQADGVAHDAQYIEPGALWWAFDSESARHRGIAAGTVKEAVDPNEELNRDRDPRRSVVLIDELDKADPDVPNGLLVPLGSASFSVEQLGIEVTRPPVAPDDLKHSGLSPLLVVITTNEERDLPPAFLRRCVDYTLPDPDKERLVAIGRLHLEAEAGHVGPDDETLLDALAARVEGMARTARDRRERPPSTAEYLDAVRACRALEIAVGNSRAWKLLARATLDKRATGQFDQG